MKKFVSVQVLMGLLMFWSVTAIAAPNSDQQNKQKQKDAGNQPTVNVQKPVDAGMKDLRMITPDMNYRERVEAQRANQKRAAAKRNAMMQTAELERKQQDKNAESSGRPESKR